MINVEVAFAKPDEQVIISINMLEGGSVLQAINLSGILEQYSEIDLSVMKIGIFGHVCALDKTVEAGERIEIYRALIQNPMDARRNRALVDEQNPK